MLVTTEAGEEAKAEGTGQVPGDQPPAGKPG